MGKTCKSMYSAARFVRRYQNVAQIWPANFDPGILPCGDVRGFFVGGKTMVNERPEPLARLDLLFEGTRIAHEVAFGLHRRLVAFDADDADTQGLLRESASLALYELPAIAAEARRLAAHWDEQSVLTPETAAETLEDLSAELERIEPDLERLRARQREIARDLSSRLTGARGR